MKQYILYLVGLGLIFIACNKDNLPNYTDYDRSLEQAVKKASADGTMDHFILPDSDDYASIPQDEKNHLTSMKVTLGGFLFHETGIALDPTHDSSEQSWSCSSCHIADAGFTPGTMQGIADGGIGFGTIGENRTINPIYEEEEIDAQGIRAISLLNAAFIENAFWNGQFGAGGANEGTEHLWNDEEFTSYNHVQMTDYLVERYANENGELIYPDLTSKYLRPSIKNLARVLGKTILGE